MIVEKIMIVLLLYYCILIIIITKICIHIFITSSLDYGMY